uniref:Uncharacterized protein n=1 Tax=Rhizophora mucronata TaxID=61149 RepID=A0A2P2R365_RHIMU
MLLNVLICLCSDDIQEKTVITFIVFWLFITG